MEVLTIAEYNTRFPNNNDDYFLGLSDREKVHYLELQGLYYDLALQYLIEKFNIQQYDDYFKNSSLNYEKIDQVNQDIYQYQSNKYLNYIYIRNNFYIERLKNEEMKFLEKKLISSNNALDGETRNFIKDTITKTIIEKKDCDNICLVNYGPETSEYLKPNNAIIFGFRYNQFDKKDSQSDIEWQELYFERLNDVYRNLGNFRINTLNSKENISYYIIEYNEFSIKPKNSLFRSDNNDLIK